MTTLKARLFTPGPTPVPPEVLSAMARPMIHHRTPEFSAILADVRSRLKPLFGTDQDVLLLSCSGTGAMEAAVANLLNPGEAAIFVNGGKFGERWGKLLQAYGVKAVEVKVEWGRPVEPEMVEDAIRRFPDARAVFIQASETSTTVVHPVHEIGRIMAGGERLLVVDGITSVGVFEQKMDEWGVDVLITGSQKALMLPPGLGIIALSERAWARAEEVTNSRFYFDLRRERKAQNQDRTTAFTPAISLIRGLKASLDLMERETLAGVFARHALMAESVRAAVRSLGLKLIAPEAPAPGITGALVPPGIDGARVVRLMRDSFGAGVAGGQDHMKGKLVRIGHMGYMDPLDMLVVIGALELALAQCGYSFETGVGVSAVQRQLLMPR